ncbi:MAG: NUDIX domain-containing protein [bacterium]|nr:NUDIX domain-containing protein [bacterium]
MKKNALLFVGQKALIEKDGKILVLICPNGWLDFPGGKLQEGEAKDGDLSSLENSLKREVKEETGFEIEVGSPLAVWYWDFPEGHTRYGEKTYLVIFKSKYVSGDFKLSDEHGAYKWVDKDNYKELDNGNPQFKILEKYFD